LSILHNRGHAAPVGPRRFQAGGSRRLQEAARRRQEVPGSSRKLQEVPR